MTLAEFKALKRGDKVTLVKRLPDGGPEKGSVGTVVVPYVEESPDSDLFHVGIRWAKFKNGHDLEGAIKSETGWFVFHDALARSRGGMPSGYACIARAN
jgi:hypothetical protein